jgi:uncharacterized protein (DUF362 family)
MKNTHEQSMEVYDRMIENPIEASNVPYKDIRDEIFSKNGKHAVSIVRTEDRNEGIMEAIRLIGGISKLTQGAEGEIVIKPNCNTDDPFPRNSHYETVKVIAETLIEVGFPNDKICVGDMSGRYRGLPTRNTIEEMGIKKVADELGIQVGYFEEEDWVTVKPPLAKSWPEGITIPKRIYEASRVILTPVVRPHRTPYFTIAMKLGVGLLEPVGREWLHWNKNQDFMNRMVDLNLAFSTDLVVTDVMQFYTGKPPVHDDMVEPGIIIAGSNRVAADAVAVCLMKQHGAHRLGGIPVRDHLTFTIGEERGIGSSSIKDMELYTSNISGDPKFEDVINQIKEELSS